MRIHRKHYIWGMSALAMGAVWTLFALLADEFALVASVGVGMTHTIGFVAAFSHLLERRPFLVVGLMISISLTYITGRLLLFLGCRLPYIYSLNPGLCGDNYLQGWYVILAAGLAILGGMGFLIVGLASKRQ